MPTFPVRFHRFGVDSVPVKMDSVPDDIVLLIFSNLDWRDKMSCSQVCKVWNRLIVSECTQAWHVASKDVLPTSSLNFDLIRTLAPKDKIRAFYCGFGKDTVSDNMYVMPNGFTVHRKPVAQSSDMARGRVGFSDGIHHWIVRWETKSLGSSAGVGVCTKNAKLHGEGYYTLVGEDNHSWGWDIVRMNLRHEGQSLQQFPPQGGSKVIVTIPLLISCTVLNACYLVCTVEVYTVGVGWQS